MNHRRVIRRAYTIRGMHMDLNHTKGRKRDWTSFLMVFCTGFCQGAAGCKFNPRLLKASPKPSIRSSPHSNDLCRDLLGPGFKVRAVLVSRALWFEACLELRDLASRGVRGTPSLTRPSHHVGVLCSSDCQTHKERAESEVHITGDLDWL